MERLHSVWEFAVIFIRTFVAISACSIPFYITIAPYIFYPEYTDRPGLPFILMLRNVSQEIVNIHLFILVIATILVLIVKKFIERIAT